VRPAEGPGPRANAVYTGEPRFQLLRMSVSVHRIASLACAALAVLALAYARSAAAQPSGADRPVTPAGLEVVWQVPGRRLRDEIAAWSIDAFSTDGKLLAVGDATGVRILRTGDGSAVRKLWPTFGDEFAYALAVSGQGAVAVGRVGKIELYPADDRLPPARHECAGACGPVGAIAFSPDGSLLAFQGARGLADRRRGLGAVRVIDTRSGAAVADLDASAARARVRFSANGRRLLAAHATPFDERELNGVRAWDVADWRVMDDLLGARRVPRAEGAIERAQFAATFEREGTLEIRDLITDGLVWSAPLVPPSFDSTGDAQASMKLRLVEIAPNGEFIVSYEAPATPGVATLGTIVIRRAAEGSVEAMYDVADVTAIAIAPDSKTFAYTTGSGQIYTVLARVPL
jgi:WD40 repeat protein